MCEVESTDVEKIRLELRPSCSADVKKFLFEYVGTIELNSSSEEELL